MVSSSCSVFIYSPRAANASFPRAAIASLDISSYDKSPEAEFIYTLRHTFYVPDIHTHLPLENLSPQKYSVFSNTKYKEASVCFITDAGNCAGDEFGAANTPDGGGNTTPPDEDWELDNKKRCEQEGYVDDKCPETAKPGTECPYDNGYHTGCQCLPEYNKLCNGYDEGGKGPSCDSKFKECCKLCSDFPYTASSIPEGYVKTSSCNSCTGIKYKAQCDASFKYTCTGANQTGGSGTACDGKYKSCKCQSNYIWNANTATCDIVCDPAYKLDCTRTSSNHITGGDGSACDGKYQRCKCDSGYTWVSSSNYCKQNCDAAFKYTCTGANQTGGSGTACDGKYKSCKCASGYTWSNGVCEQNKNGVDDDGLHYCNGQVDGVRVNGTNIVVGYKDVGNTFWTGISSFVSSFKFCGKSGRLPTKAELQAIYRDMDNIKRKLAENGGTQFSSAWYWTSDYSGKCPWHEGGDYYYIVNPITGATRGTGCDAVDYLHVRAVMDI